MKKVRQKFNVGDWVQSHYRARWIGVVQSVYWLSTGDGVRYPCYYVKSVLTCDGRKQVNQLGHHLAQGWLRKHEGEIWND